MIDRKFLGVGLVVLIIGLLLVTTRTDFFIKGQGPEIDRRTFNKILSQILATPTSIINLSDKAACAKRDNWFKEFNEFFYEIGYLSPDPNDPKTLFLKSNLEFLMGDNYYDRPWGGLYSDEEFSQMFKLLRRAPELGINLNQVTMFDFLPKELLSAYPGATTKAQQDEVLDNIKKGQPEKNAPYAQTPRYSSVSELEEILEANRKEIARLKTLKNVSAQELSRISMVDLTPAQQAQLKSLINKIDDFDSQVISILEDLTKKQQEVLFLLEKSASEQQLASIYSEIDNILRRKSELFSKIARDIDNHIKVLNLTGEVTGGTSTLLRFRKAFQDLLKNRLASASDTLKPALFSKLKFLGRGAVGVCACLIVPSILEAATGASPPLTEEQITPPSITPPPTDKPLPDLSE